MRTEICNIGKIKIRKFLLFVLHLDTYVTTVSKRLNNLRSNNDGYSSISKNDISSFKSSSKRRHQHHINSFQIRIRFGFLTLLNPCFRQHSIDVLWIIHNIASIAVAHLPFVELGSCMSKAKDIIFVCLHCSDSSI